MLPYFIRSEAQRSAAPTPSTARDGPLWVSRHRREARADRGLHRRRRRDRRAAHRRLQRRAPGRRRLLPAQHLEGPALQHRHGLPAQPRAVATNLRVETEAQATRPRVRRQARRRACATARAAPSKVARCRGEVLLAAGALQSPQLLQLSGIGPAALLQQHGIPVVARSSGRRREPAGPSADPPDLRMHASRSPPTTSSTRWLGQRDDRPAVAAVAQRPAGGRHQPGRLLHARAARRRRQLVAARPDIQFHVATLSADMAGGAGAPVLGLHDVGLPAAPRIARPRARSARPTRSQPPSMQPNYLATELDRRTAVAGMRAARAIAAAPSMRPYVAREVKPGRDADDDAALLEFARNNGATIFHPCGTCRMGNDAARRRRCTPARARHRAAARRRLFGDADAGVGQHQCSRRS